MENKLRKINVEDVIFYWTVVHDKNAPEEDFVLLRIWIAGQKSHPWITVHYHFHNIWLFYGEVISVQTPEQRERVETFFQFEPLKPKKVAGIIRLAMNLLNDKYSDKLYNKNVNFYLENNGKLQWTKSD